MAGIAQLGSSSNHGGQIVGGTATTVFVEGIPVALEGSLHSCPIKGHGVTPVVSTIPQISYVEGRKIATILSICGCGAVITTGAAISGAE